MPQRYQGSTIGKYRIDRLLGAGAFAWVYQATDLDLEIQVALKLLRPEFVGHESVVARFRREATLAAKLRHPNIVTIRDIGELQGAVFVAMDLHPLTLGRRLEILGKLSETEVVRLGIGIAAALAAAHGQQIVHRDIKPDNILIDQNGEAVVADFGLARALSSSSSVSITNQVLGTPHYFSPEQARGLELDGRSDLYSLGATLYRAATGSLLFEGEDWYAVARQHIESEPRSPRDLAPDLTPEFSQILRRLLAKNPKDRYGTAIEAFDAMLALPSAPPSPQATPLRSAAITIDVARPASASRRHYWISGAIAGFIAVAALGTAFWPKTHTPVSAVTPNAITADSSLLTSVTPVNDSGAVTAQPQAAPPVEVASASPDRKRPATKPVTLTVISAPDAELFLNGKLLANGEWTGTHAAQDSLYVRAVLSTASVDCETALMDTVLTHVSAGEHIKLTLPVRRCVVVRYLIQPRDARVAFSPLDGGRVREVRADSAAVMSLPVGKYLMRISAPRCSTFQDTVLVEPSRTDNPISRRLICS